MWLGCRCVLFWQLSIKPLADNAWPQSTPRRGKPMARARMGERARLREEPDQRACWPSPSPLGGRRNTQRIVSWCLGGGNILSIRFWFSLGKKIRQMWGGIIILATINVQSYTWIGMEVGKKTKDPKDRRKVREKKRISTKKITMENSLIIWCGRSKKVWTPPNN